MKGSAPNSPATGSQVLVRPEAQPELLDRQPRLAGELHADRGHEHQQEQRNTRRCATRKPQFADARSAGRSGNLDRSERRQSPASRRCRAAARSPVGGEFLPVGERPLHEVDHHLRAGLVRRLLVQQHPGERRNRIGAGARRVGDRHAEVGRASSAPAAAAVVTASSDALTNSPAAFCTDPKAILFCSA